MDKERLKAILTKEIPESQVLIDEPMSKHTSFKIGGNADLFAKIRRVEELKYCIRIAKEEKIDIIIIGNGSNVLVKDDGIRGIVLKMELEEILIQRSTFDKTKIEDTYERNEEDVIVTVGCGVKLGELAQRLLKEEITGFEFAAGIPGTIGGAVRMNAGAYGGEMKDIVIETKCLDLEYYEKMTIGNTKGISESDNKNLFKMITLNHAEQNFSYRYSIFAERKYIILETKLRLRQGKYKEIKAKMDEYLASRIEKQPIYFPSAGSTFKRGADYITAKIIDECGLKGYKLGGARVSEKHAGFVVNEGNATAQNVLDLIKYVQAVVYEKTGKRLELEIEILGK